METKHSWPDAETRARLTEAARAWELFANALEGAGDRHLVVSADGGMSVSSEAVPGRSAQIGEDLARLVRGAQPGDEAVVFGAFMRVADAPRRSPRDWSGEVALALSELARQLRVLQWPPVYSVAELEDAWASEELGEPLAVAIAEELIAADGDGVTAFFKTCERARRYGAVLEIRGHEGALAVIIARWIAGPGWYLHQFGDDRVRSGQWREAAWEGLAALADAVCEQIAD